MKSIRYIGLMMAVGMMAATSCSDFDDYNTAPLDPSQTANKTLWENISETSELSDFASLLKKAGFDKMLSQPTYYTVFAPVNGSYDANALMQEDGATLRQHFAENHIVYYNHQASGSVNERLKTLNEKSYSFVGDGSYTFGNVAVSEANLPSINGTLHLLNGEVAYHPNIYEYIFQAPDRDSLANYFRHYEHSVLDASKSTLGPVVNGKQTYIDSVIVVNNDLFSRNELNAHVEREDSNYTIIMPSNEAWAKLYKKISGYYKYIPTLKYQNVERAESFTNFPDGTVTANAAYFTDSLTKKAIASYLIFNNNDRYNRWVENKNELNTDTISMTARNCYITDPQQMLDQTKEKVTMSNGYARLVDSLAIHPWDWYAPELRSLALGKDFSSNTSVVRVDNVDPTKVTLEPGQSTLRYIHAEPTSLYSRPQLVMMLPNVLSTKYNIYVVLVPPNVDLENAAMEVKPNRLNFEVSFCQANGNLQRLKLNQKVVNDPSKVDTVYAGTVTFPVSYYGLGVATTVAPNLKISSEINVFNKVQMANYTRDIRIARVIMRPVEYDEYLGNKH